MPHARRLAAMLALLVVTALAWPARAAAEPLDFAGVNPADYTYHDWYLDTIDGRAAGYWHAWLAVEHEHLLSGYEEVSYETHGGELMKSVVRVLWTETHDFRPLRVVVETETGSDAVKQTYVFLADGVELTSEQSGRSITQKLPPITDKYLTAAQYTIALDRMIASGVDGFELAVLDPQVGLKPYTTRYEKAGDATEPFALANDNRADATKWRVTYSALPGFESFEWIDKDRRSVGLSYDIGGALLVAKLADESVATVDFDPPELSGLSVVVPDRPIDRPLVQKRIVYELFYDAGGEPVAPPNTAHQSVEPIDGGVRVTVDINDAAPTAEGDRPTDAQLAASIRVDHNDPAVRALAEQAVRGLGDNPSPMRIARACRQLVTRHVSGASLAVGDGTASEVARTRRGDCTECAVLLAALLRANGIPARCVNGLVYSEDEFVGHRNVFVYHMWTQAWVQNDDDTGGWVDLDSAMLRYGPTHITLGVTNAGDNDQAEVLRLLPMMRDLRIKVIDASR